MRWRRLASGALTAAALAGAACGDPAGGADSDNLPGAVAAHRGGAEVTGPVVLVSEPQESGGHERMRVRDSAGDPLEIDHNTTLAQPVPAHSGDSLTVHGQLYVDPGQVGIHCTHARTSSGCPQPGWIEYRGHRYS